MSTYRTLSERRVLDQSLHSLRFSRTARQAGWNDELIEDTDAPTGAAIVWAAGCALVAVVGLLVWVAA